MGAELPLRYEAKASSVGRRPLPLAGGASGGELSPGPPLDRPMRPWTFLSLAFALPLAAQQRAVAPLTVSSPAGALVVTVGLGDQLTWGVTLRGRAVLLPSRLGLTLAPGPGPGARPPG